MMNHRVRSVRPRAPRCSAPLRHSSFATSALMPLVLALLLSSSPGLTCGNFLKSCCQLAPTCAQHETCSQDTTGTVHLSCRSMENKDNAGFFSRGWYEYGLFSVSLRLPQGYSGGFLPGMFLESGEDALAEAPGQGSTRTLTPAENNKGPPIRGKGLKTGVVGTRISWEFQGGRTPADMILHTNVIVAGQQHLHQFKFPFDPSTSFHTYTLRWNAESIAWMVDWHPIRILHLSKHRPWPTTPLRLKVSALDSSTWTQLKSKYSETGPVEVQVNDVALQGCRVTQAKKNRKCVNSQEISARFPWNGPLEAWQYSAWKILNRTHFVNGWDWDDA